MSRPVVAVAALVAFLLPSVAHAELWCAYPLRVHEWGVQVFGDDPARVTGDLPDFFHTSGPATEVVDTNPVRMYPADSGVRAVPVVQFYSFETWSGAEVALGVGFREGEASSWYPQVDALRSADAANADASMVVRSAMEETWAAMTAWEPTTDPGTDPSLQLFWNHLTLTNEPAGTPVESTVGWVEELRSSEHAMWVESGGVTERFVFYEADTEEEPLVSVSGPGPSGEMREVYQLQVTGDFDIQHAWLVHNEDELTWIEYIELLPAGSLTEVHLGEPADGHWLLSEGRLRMQELFVDPDEAEFWTKPDRLRGVPYGENSGGANDGVGGVSALRVRRRSVPQRVGERALRARGHDPHLSGTDGVPGRDDASGDVHGHDARV